MRYLYLFIVIVMFAVLWTLYTPLYNLPDIGVQPVGEEYINKTASGTLNITGDTSSLEVSLLGNIQIALNIFKVFFTTLVLPGNIIMRLGFPGSDIFGLILNLVVWFIELRAMLEILRVGKP